MNLGDFTIKEIEGLKKVKTAILLIITISIVSIIAINYAWHFQKNTDLKLYSSKDFIVEDIFPAIAREVDFAIIKHIYETRELKPFPENIDRKQLILANTSLHKVLIECMTMYNKNPLQFGDTIETRSQFEYRMDQIRGYALRAEKIKGEEATIMVQTIMKKPISLIYWVAMGCLIIISICAFLAYLKVQKFIAATGIN